MITDIDLDRVYSLFLEHYDMCKNDPETIIMRRAASMQLKAPLFISWEITSICNLSCRHCRAAFNHSRQISGYPPLKEYKRVIHDLGKNEIFRIGITGGEPFLHPYLFDIISSCKQEGMDVILYTNATLIGEKEAAVLSNILSEDDIVHVSLDGGNAIANDAQRGPGVFSKTMEGLKCLRRHGISIRLNIVPTIYNEDSLLELCDIAINLGVKELGASPLMLSGRATLMNIAPNYQRLFQTEIQVVDKLKNTGVKYIGGISGTVHNYLSAPMLMESGIFSLKRDACERKRCDAGNRKIFIDACGDVFPCSLFAAFPAFSKGNIFQETLTEIWNNDNWKCFREGIPISSPQCPQCPLFSLCNGGCMALAYQASGNLENMDPRCPNYVEESNSEENTFEKMLFKI